jgi:hypothetical protein
MAGNTYSQSVDICFQKSGICSFERNFQMGAHQFCVEIQDVCAKRRGAENSDFGRKTPQPRNPNPCFTRKKT